MQWHVGNTSMETRNAEVVKGLLYLLTHLSPRMCLDLGKFELGVVWIHLTDLLSGWGTKNLRRTGQMGRFNFNSYSLVKKKQTP